MALLIKFVMTWETRLRSVRKIQFGIFSTKHTCTPSCAFKREDCSISENSWLTSTSESTNSSVPASILARSRISLINCNSRSLLLLMILIYSSLSSIFSVTANNPEKPTIAFNGVRISWLIFAKNADFKRSDSSAFSFAFLSSFSACFCFVTSSFLKITPIRLSCSSNTGFAKIWRYFPSPNSFVISTCFLVSMAFATVQRVQ